MSKNKKPFFERLNKKYVFSYRAENKFLESAKATFKVSEILSMIGLMLIILLFFSYFLFRYSPLKHLIHSNGLHTKTKYIELIKETDSLKNLLEVNQTYIDNVAKIMNDEIINEPSNDNIEVDELKTIEIKDPSAREQEIIANIQEREAFSLGEEESTRIHFMIPLEGVISNKFHKKEEHFGIDIVAPKNTPVLATADGIVIYSDWSEQDGNTIILSHENDYISIYKHNERLNKKIGDRAIAGEAIAIIGNSGENTTGYHLHFELWQNGLPINPTELLNFPN